jgi:short subunit dehydrogenase-like uncharacterized protein
MFSSKATKAAGAGSSAAAAAAAPSATPPNTPRDFDVVVYGASGFTGRLVCEHLARDYSGKPNAKPAAEAPTVLPQTGNPKVRWAMAGRDEGKMSAVARDLAEKVWGDASLASEVPLLVADANDGPALEKVAARTKVLLTTAGPYAKYGDAVVRAAVATKTHYCDLTGEVLWARRTAQALHQEASEAGVKVVCMSGFDSIPSELAAWISANELWKKTGKRAGRVVCAIGPTKGGFSGGTVASGLNQARAEDPAEVKRSFADAYYLSHGVAPFTEGSEAAALLPPRVDRPAPNGPLKTPLAQRVAALVEASPGARDASKRISPPAPYLAPFVMASINQKVVHRSEALWRLREQETGQRQQSPFSPKGFTYLEAMGVPSLPVAVIVSAANLGIGAMFAFSPLRALAEKTFLPAPGEGPSRELMLGGYWSHCAFAVADDEEEARKAGKEPAVAVVALGDPNRDAGYFGTSRMLLETGLCLALEERACEEAGALGGGCLTPTTATGAVPLVKRLRAAGLTIEVLAVDEGAAAAN